MKILSKKQKEDALAEEIKNIKKWINPKTKIRRVYKIEEDGTKTTARVIDFNGIPIEFKYLLRSVLKV